MQFLKRLKPMVSPVQNSAANTIYVDSDTNEVKVGTAASGTTERVLLDTTVATSTNLQVRALGVGTSETDNGEITSAGSMQCGSHFTFTADGAALSWINETVLSSPADGILLASNYAGTGFTRLILGTNNASGVAWGKSGDTIQALLGDASALTNIQATSYGGGTTAGTTITNDSQAVANDAAIFLGASPLGMLFIANSTDGYQAIFELQAGANATAEISDPHTIYSVTKDAAGSINVYYDAAGASGAGYYLQNKRGGSRTIRLVLLGA